MTAVNVERALISVYDKSGLVEFAKRLVASGCEIVSSGGTARALREAGLAVTDVADVTGSPEMLGGRVKTIHPRIHGGILADPGRPDHRADLAAHGIAPFQLVVVNLYPFEQTVAAADATEAEAIEQIDIGGPAAIRAAAKNHAAVGVVTSPAQYDEVAGAVEAGGLDAGLRCRLAEAAFYRTAAYDAAIVTWMNRGEDLPERAVLALERRAVLRYGENPHQAAAVYAEAGAGEGWWDGAAQLQGKQLSFNNLVDAEAAWRLVCDLPVPAVVIVKHTNPSGVALGRSEAEAFAAAWACDPLSSFGGVVAVNAPLDEPTAQSLAELFVEVVVAPQVTASAAAVLAPRDGLRVLQANRPGEGDIDLRRLESGLLMQRRDVVSSDPASWDLVAGPEIDAATRRDLELAWTVAGHTKSNAVVIAKDGAAVGVGAGDQSRVGAAERAVSRAGGRAMGAVAASDAFFPFRDGLDVLADAGVRAVVEPGGSRRDPEVIAAAEERGVTLLFTSARHFRH